MATTATPKTAGKSARKPTTSTTTTKTAAPRPAAKRPAAKKAAAPAKRSSVAGKAAPAAKKARSSQAAPQKPKQKLVRDSFTMPQQDFDLIAALKKRALAGGHATKKSELLRAGLHVLTRLDDAAVRAVLEGLIQLKAGRPRKDR